MCKAPTDCLSSGVLSVAFMKILLCPWSVFGFAQTTFFIIMNFYETAKWKRKRLSILKRDGFQCRECKRFGKIREATEVHHIKHYDEFPELALVDSNLVSLCKGCHNAQHKEKGMHKKFIRGDKY